MYTTCRFTQKKLLKPGLKLIGAKTKTRDKLYQLKPKGIRQYIEPFLGSGTILVGMDPAEVEHVGDLNEFVINFYKVLQTDPEGFWSSYEFFYEKMLQLESVVPSAGFGGLKELLNNHPRLLSSTKAVLFYLITKHSMNGIWRLNKKGQCNSSFCKTIKGRGIYSKEWFDKVCERIKNTQFHHGSYKGLLQAANRREEENKFVKAAREVSGKPGPPIPEETWVLLDPPYHSCQTTYNGIAWRDKEYQELFEFLSKAEYKWLLTINKDDFIVDLFKDYSKIDNHIFYSCSQTSAGRGIKNELIITNYEINLNEIRETVRESRSKKKVQQGQPV